MGKRFDRRIIYHTELSNIFMALNTRKADIRLPGKGNLNSHGARPVHQIISMTKWIRTNRLPINNSHSLASSGGATLWALTKTSSQHPRSIRYLCTEQL